MDIMPFLILTAPFHNGMILQKVRRSTQRIAGIFLRRNSSHPVNSSHSSAVTSVLCLSTRAFEFCTLVSQCLCRLSLLLLVLLLQGVDDVRCFLPVSLRGRLHMLTVQVSGLHLGDFDRMLNSPQGWGVGVVDFLMGDLKSSFGERKNTQRF